MNQRQTTQIEDRDKEQMMMMNMRSSYSDEKNRIMVDATRRNAMSSLS